MIPVASQLITVVLYAIMFGDHYCVVVVDLQTISLMQVCEDSDCCVVC